MPGASFLHVQGHGESAIRILELPDGPVRVGRSPHCEVRLDGPSPLGDVQCILRRRGEGWHFQLVGPAGLVWIDDRPADQSRPLAFGIPFRVGNHWLTLRSAENATNDWGSFASPITVEPVEASVEPEPEVEVVVEVEVEVEVEAPPAIDPPAEPPPATATAEAVPIDPGPSDDADDRLARWQSRLDQRERWLKDRQDEKRWEARWKAAGESIKARSPRPATPPRTPPTPAPAPASQPPPVPIQVTRPGEARVVARPVELRPAEPLRRVIDPSARPEPPRFPSGPRAHRPSGLGQGGAARPSGGFAPTPPRADPLAALNAPKVEWSSTRVEPLPIFAIPPPPPIAPPRPAIASPIAPAPPAPVAERGPAPIEPPRPLEDEPGPIAAEAEAVAVVPEAEARPEAVEAEPEPEVEDEGATGVDLESGWDEASPFETETFDILPASAWHELPAPVVERPRPLEVAPSPAPPAKLMRPSPRPAPDARAATSPGPPWPEPGPRDLSSPHDPSAAEWPTARAIFAAQGRRLDGSPEPAPARESSRAARRRARVAVPTEAVAPDQWTLPFWLGWFPTTALTLALGIAGLALCYEWLGDASLASRAIQIATRDADKASPTVDLAAIPRGPWWRTTAGHLSAWAMAVERIGDGEDHSADVRNLMDDARHVSALAAGARFVLESAPASESDPVPLLFQVGRPRDAATLAWTGRHLRKAGKVEASLGAFRSAFEMASKAARRDLDPPSFDADPRYRRYALPHESLLGFVARVMVGSGDWTLDQWDQALPRFATARVAVAKALRGKDSLTSDRVLDRAIARADEPRADTADAGEDRAAVAEALALRRRYPEAKEAYRRAIEAVADDLTRRRWSINLAEIALRDNDQRARALALDAARGTETTDEITKRALDLQQTLAGGPSRGPGT